MSSPRGGRRREFSQKVRKAAFRRCCENGTKPGIPQCERPGCGKVLVAGNIEFEHLDPDGLGGEPTLENCGVWCAVPCSSRKTAEVDNPRMAKADAVLRSTYGLKPARKKIQSAGFARVKPQRSASRPLKRKNDYAS